MNSSVRIELEMAHRQAHQDIGVCLVGNINNETWRFFACFIRPFEHQ